MAFLNPAFLWFMIGGSIPIIIHLLHRQKFRRVRWAAMEFLLAALRKTQRRLQIENLILLLLRVLIMLLLALAISRPFFKEAPVAALGESDTHHIFVIDNSYSMAYKNGPKSYLDTAKETADKQLTTLKKLSEEDKISVLLMNSYPEVFVPESNKLQYVQRSIGDIRISHYGTSAYFTFQLIQETVEKSRNQQKRVYIFTDFQRSGWEPGDEKEVKLFKELLKKLSEKQDVRILMIDVGARQGVDNRAVVDLRVEQKVVATRRTTNFSVDVQNWSSSSFPAVEVTLSVDGSALPKKTIPLPAQSMTTVNFSHEFVEPGPHFVDAAIEPDFLDVDDRRFLALDVKSGLNGLLVDGDPGTKRWESETDYLRTALDPSGEGRFFKCDVKTTELFTGEQLEGFDFIVLANVQSLTTEKIDALEKYVSSGGGLFLSMGAKVSPVSYNQMLFKEGKGLMPASLPTEISGTGPDIDPRIPVRMNHINYDHKSFSVFKKGLQHAPRDLIFYQYFKLEKYEHPDVSKIADYDDATGTPVFLEKKFGDGKVILFNNTLDGEWNAGTPGRPPYLAVMWSTMEYLASRPASRKNLLVGEGLQHSMTVDKYQPSFVLDTPHEGQISIAPTAPRQDDKYVHLYYPVRRMDRKPEEKRPVENDGLKFAGRYTLARANAKEDEKPVSYFAANVPPRVVTPEELLRSEGNPERIERDELTRRYDGFKFEVIGEKKSGGEVDLQKDPTHLWKYLLYLLAGFLVLEAVLAWLFGRAKQ